jgi:hypothetical protein
MAGIAHEFPKEKNWQSIPCKDLAFTRDSNSFATLVFFNELKTLVLAASALMIWLSRSSSKELENEL